MSLIHCDLLFSRVVRHSANMKHFKQICGYLMLHKQVLETSYCNICPWHLKQRQYPAVNCINLCHKAECFTSPPSRVRGAGKHYTWRDTKADCSPPSSGKRPERRTYTTKHLSYNLCFFSVQSKNKEESDRKMLGTLFMIRGALCS